MSVTYVSAFHDLGRDRWSHFSRSFENYLECFKIFIRQFSDADEGYNMVLYIDRHLSPSVTQFFTSNTRIRIVEIDEDWMANNLPMWRTKEREAEIMKDPKFHEMVGKRITCPECCNPEYTLINHCKIDFIGHAIDTGLCSADWYAWVDFGYYGDPTRYEERVPKNFIDPNKLDSGTINYTLINMVDSRDRSIEYALRYAPERIGGFFFFGSRTKMKEFQNLYHRSLERLQELCVADDDQALVLFMTFVAPDLFTLHYAGSWHRALIIFQKN